MLYNFSLRGLSIRRGLCYFISGMLLFHNFFLLFADSNIENDGIKIAYTTDAETSPTTDAETSPTTDAETSPTTDAETSPTTDAETSPTTDAETSPTTDAETSPTTDAETSPTTDAETSPTTDAETSPTNKSESPIISNSFIINSNDITFSGSKYFGNGGYILFGYCNKDKIFGVTTSLILNGNASEIFTHCSPNNDWTILYNNLSNGLFNVNLSTEPKNSLSSDFNFNFEFIVNNNSNICTITNADISITTSNIATTSVTVNGTCNAAKFTQVKVKLNGIEQLVSCTVANTYSATFTNLNPNTTYTAEARSMNPINSCTGTADVATTFKTQQTALCPSPLTGSDLTYTTASQNSLTSYTLNGTCTSAKVASVNVTITNGTQQYSASATCTNNTWSATVNNLQPGTYTGTATATAIDTSCPTISVPVSFACVHPPVCTITNADISITTSNIATTSVTVNGTCNAAKFTQVKVKLNGIEQLVSCTVANTYSATFTNLNPNTTYTAEARSMNPINSCTGTADVATTFKTQQTALCPSPLTGSDLTYTTATQNSLTSYTLNGTCTSAKVASVNVTITNGTQQYSASATCTNNTWSATVNNLQPGTYTGTATATAIDTSCPTISVPVSFACVHPPVCTITNADLSITTSNIATTSVTVNGTCNAAKFTQVKVKLNGIEQLVSCTVANTYSATFTNLNPNTTYTAEARSMNPINSCTGTADVATTFKTQQAALCPSPLTGSDLTYTTATQNSLTSYTLNGTCTSAKVASVNVTITNGTQQYSASATCTNNTWSATVNNLQPGTYTGTATATAIDTSCPTISVPVSFACVHPPVCTITNADISITTSNIATTSVTVNGTCNAAKFTQVKVKLNGIEQLVSCTVANTYSATFTNLNPNTTYTAEARSMNPINSCTGTADVATTFKTQQTALCPSPLTGSDLTYTTASQNSLTSYTLNGTCTSAKVASVNVTITNGTQQYSASATCTNNTWSATVNNLQPGTYTGTATATAIDTSCPTISVPVSFACVHPPVCTITNADISITTSNIATTSVTVNGTCNAAKFTQVKVKLNGIEQLVSCTVANTYSATFTNLNPNTTYTAEARSMNPINSCTGTADVATTFKTQQTALCPSPLTNSDLTFTAATQNSLTSYTLNGTCTSAKVASVNVTITNGTQQYSASATCTNNVWSTTFNNLQAGNYTGTATATAIDTSCPKISVPVSFANSSICIQQPSFITLNYNDAAIVSSNTITLIGSFSGSVNQVRINNTSIPFTGNTFSSLVSLASGTNTFTIQLMPSDASCTTVSKTIQIIYQPNQVCQLQLNLPTTNISTINDSVTIAGSVNYTGNNVSITVLPNNIQIPLIASGSFSSTFGLAVGTQIFTIIARDTVANCEDRKTVTVTRDQQYSGYFGGNNYCGDGLVRSTEQCDHGRFNDSKTIISGIACDINCRIVEVETPKVVIKQPIKKKLQHTFALKEYQPLELVIKTPQILPKTGSFIVSFWSMICEIFDLN